MRRLLVFARSVEVQRFAGRKYNVLSYLVSYRPARARTTGPSSLALPYLRTSHSASSYYKTWNGYGLTSP